MENRRIQDKVNTKIILYVISFILSAVPALFLTAPFVEDSLGTMAAAAYLTGSDFSEFLIEKGFYYKYGQSLFYLPIFALIHEPVLRYKLLLVVNSAIMSFIPVIMYQISKKHLRLSTIDSAGASLISGLMPSALLYAKLTWAEPMLFLIPWIIIYFLLELCDIEDNLKVLYTVKNGNTSDKTVVHFHRRYSLDDLKFKDTLNIPVSTMLSHNDLIKKRTRFSALLAFISVMAFLSHQRGIVAVIAVLIFLILVRLVYKTTLVNPFSYGLGLTISLLTDRLLDNWLKTTVYRGVELKHNLLSSFLRPEIYQKLFSAQGLLVVLRTILGWLYNSSVSGMGFTILGMVLCISCGFGLGKRKTYFSMKFKYIALIGSLLYIGAFLLGMLFFFEGGYDYWMGTSVERCDHLVFGRYLESSLPIMMFLGLYGITRLSQSGNVVDLKEKIIKKDAILSAIVQGVLFLFFIIRIAPAMEHVDSYVHSIMSMNFCFNMTGVASTKDFIANLPAALIVVGIVAIFVYVAVSLLFMGGNKRLAYIVLAGISLYIYARSFIDILYRIDVYGLTDYAKYYLGN